MGKAVRRVAPPLAHAGRGGVPGNANDHNGGFCKGWCVQGFRLRAVVSPERGFVAQAEGIPGDNATRNATARRVMTRVWVKVSRRCLAGRRFNQRQRPSGEFGHRGKCLSKGQRSAIRSCRRDPEHTVTTRSPWAHRSGLFDKFLVDQVKFLFI